MSDSSSRLRSWGRKAADVGFEALLQSHGAGFRIWEEENDYRGEKKRLYDALRGMGLVPGGYQNFLQTKAPIPNGAASTCPARPNANPTLGLASNGNVWYQTKMRGMVEASGMRIMEFDAAYPLTVCNKSDHAFMVGGDDSQHKQWVINNEMYAYLRGRDVYLHVSDWHYLNGTNKTSVGYEEDAWKRPRKEQLLVDRMYIYNGTYEKSPPWAWSSIPNTSFKESGRNAYFSPQSENIADYHWAVAQNFLSGVQHTFRGGALYDNDDVEEMLQYWVDVYKTYRPTLKADVIHIRPPRRDARNHERATGIDAFLHATAAEDERAIVAVFNQTDSIRSETLPVPLYYTGLTARTTPPMSVPGSYLSTTADIPKFGRFPVREYAGLVPEWGEDSYPEATTTGRRADFHLEGAGEATTLAIDSNGNAMLPVTLPPLSFAWYVVTAPGVSPAAPPSKPNGPPAVAAQLPALSIEDWDETSSVLVSVADAFSDPDGDALTYGASSSSPEVAQATASGSGVWLTPASVGTTTVAVTATDPDGWGTYAAQTFEVTVSIRAPQAVGRLADLLLHVSDGARQVDVSGAFVDAEGNALAYGASSSSATVAAVAVSGSTVSVTPLSTGEATVTVTAMNEAGTAKQTFGVAVTNRSPEAVGALGALSLVVAGGAGSVEVSGAFRDPDGDALTYAARSSSTSVVTVSVAGSTVTVRPVSGGTATVEVTATDVDGSNTSATQTFEATVTNRSPEAVGRLAALTLRVADGAESVDVSVAFRDPDGDALTYAARSSSTPVATVSVSGSTVTVRPVAEGTATVTVTATDAGGSNTSATQTLGVEVSANESPETVGTLDDRALRVQDEASTVDVSGAFRDPDRDGLTFAASSSNEAVVAVSVSGSRVSMRPVAEGTATVEVTATDTGGSNTSATQRLAVTVSSNGSPEVVLSLPALSLRVEDGAETVEVSSAFRDRDGDALSYGASSSDLSVATASVSGSTVTVTPVSGGTAVVAVTATDRAGSNTTARQAFEVAVANRTPVAEGRLPPLSLRMEHGARIGRGGGRVPGSGRRRAQLRGVVVGPVGGAGVGMAGVGVGDAGVGGDGGGDGDGDGPCRLEHDGAPDVRGDGGESCARSGGSAVAAVVARGAGRGMDRGGECFSRPGRRCAGVCGLVVGPRGGGGGGIGFAGAGDAGVVGDGGGDGDGGGRGWLARSADSRGDGAESVPGGAGPVAGAGAGGGGRAGGGGGVGCVRRSGRRRADLRGDLVERGGGGSGDDGLDAAGGAADAGHGDADGHGDRRRRLEHAGDADART